MSESKFPPRSPEEALERSSIPYRRLEDGVPEGWKKLDFGFFLSQFDSKPLEDSLSLREFCDETYGVGNYAAMRPNKDVRREYETMVFDLYADQEEERYRRDVFEEIAARFAAYTNTTAAKSSAWLRDKWQLFLEPITVNEVIQIVAPQPEKSFAVIPMFEVEGVRDRTLVSLWEPDVTKLVRREITRRTTGGATLRLIRGGTIDK